MAIRDDFELDITSALSAVDELGAALTASLAGAVDVLAAGLGDASLAAASVGDSVSASLSAAGDAAAVSVGDSMSTAVSTAVGDAIGTAVADTGGAAADALGSDVLSALTVAGQDGAVALADVLQSEVAIALEGGVTAGVGTAADAMQSEIFAALEAGASVGLAQGIGAGVQAGESDIEALAQPITDVVAQAVSDGIGEASSSSGIDQLGATAGAAGDQAAQGLGKAAGAGKALDIAVAGASGSLAGSVGEIAKLVPGAAVIGALGAATFKWFESAEAVHASQERLTVVFGDQAAAVQHIDIGGLTGSLGGLANKAGSTGSSIRQATADLGALGHGFGASNPQILATTEQIQALALRAVALKPKLGDAGEAVKGLTNALLTGRAKALATYSVGLDKTAVAARATEIALSQGRTEVTKFDTIAAGAAIVTEHLGKSLGTDFNKGVQQSSVVLKALGIQVRSAIAEGGAPLVEPLIHAAQDLTPVAVGLAKAVGGILLVTTPLAAGLAGALAGSLNLVGGGFAELRDSVGSVLPDLSSVGTAVSAVGGFFSALNDHLGGFPGKIVAIGGVFLALSVAVNALDGPLLRGAAGFVGFAGSAAGTLPVVGAAAKTMATEVQVSMLQAAGATEAASKLMAASSAESAGVIAASGAEAVVAETAVGEAAVVASEEIVVATTAAEASNPFGWIIAGIGAVVAGFGLFHHSHAEAKVDIGDVSKGLSTEALSMAGAGAAAQDLGQKMADALSKSNDFKPFAEELAKDSNKLKGALAEVGLGTRDLQHDLNSGSAGLGDYLSHFQAAQAPTKNFVLAIEAAGFSTDSFARALADGDKKAGKLLGSLAVGKDGFSSFGDATSKYAITLGVTADGFEKAQKAQNDYYKGQINALHGTVPLTAAQEKQLKSGKDLAGLYVTLTSEQQHLADAQAKAVTDTFTAAGGWQTLATAVIRAGGSYANLPPIAGSDKLDPKAVQAFAKEVSGALDQVTQDAASTLPATGDAVKTWSSDISTAFGKLQTAASASKKNTKDIKAAQEGLAFATDPQRIIDNIDAQRHAIEGFSNNVAALFASGNVRAAQEALKLGPAAGAAYAQSLVSAGPKVEAGANNALLGADHANADFLNRVQTQWGPQIVGAYGQVAQNADGTFSFKIGTGGTSKQALTENLQQTGAAFGAASPQFASAAANLGLTAAEALRTGLVTFPDKADNAAVAAARSMRFHHDDWRSAGSSLGAAAASGVDASAPAVAAAGSAAGAHAAGPAGLTGGIQGGVAQHKDGITKAGLDAIAALTGTEKDIEQIYAAGTGLGNLFDAGMAAGVRGNGGTVESAARELVARVEAAARSAAQTHSPSKLFAKIGEDLTSGLAEGIGSNTSLPVGQVKSLVTRLSNAAIASALDAETTFAKASAAHVLGVATAALQHNLGGLKRQSDDLLQRAALDSVKAVGSAVTHLGNAGRAGLTTGATSLQDLVAPIGSSIDKALSGFTASLNHDIDKAGSATIKTFSALTSEEQHRLDSFRKLGDAPPPTVSAFGPSAAKAVPNAASLQAAPQFAGIASALHQQLAVEVKLPEGLQVKSLDHAKEIGNAIGEGLLQARVGTVSILTSLAASTH